MSNFYAAVAYPLQTYRDIGESYRIRSRFVHGVVVKDDDQLAPRLISITMDILRIALVACMVNKEFSDKNEILSTIDDSLLGVRPAQETLISLCKRAIEILPPIRTNCS